MATKHYFKVDKKSKIAIVHNKYMDDRKEAILAAREYVHGTLNADKNRICDNGEIHSVIFNTPEKVPKGLRNKSGYCKTEYFPDRRTKVGKAIAKKFTSFEIEKDTSPDLINHGSFFGRSGSVMCMYSPQVWRSGCGTIIVILHTTDKK